MRLAWPALQPRPLGSQEGESMYNRYIPQSDGSYKRKSTPDAEAPAPPPKSDLPKPSAEMLSRPSFPNLGINNFIKQILPKGLDIGDLIVVLLLLLLGADRKEEQNNALLTLAIYLFL